MRRMEKVIFHLTDSVVRDSCIISHQENTVFFFCCVYTCYDIFKYKLYLRNYERDEEKKEREREREREREIKKTSESKR